MDMSNKIILGLALGATLLTSAAASAQETGFSPAFFMGASVSQTTVDFAGGGTTLATAVGATNLDLGFGGAPVGSTFVVDDKKGMGFSIMAGAMLNENFGAVVSYSTDPDTKYKYHAIPAAGTAVDLKASSKSIGLQGMLNYSIDDQMGVMASIGMCRVTQNHNTSPTAPATSVDISEWVMCGSAGGYYTINEQFKVFADFSMSQEKKDKTTVSNSIVKTSGIDLGFSVSL